MKKLLILLLLSSCVTREKINSVIWLNNFPLPQAYCDQIPELKSYGFYRRLNDGRFELINVCKKEARNMITATEKDFNEIIDQALPRPREIDN